MTATTDPAKRLHESLRQFTTCKADNVKSAWAFVFDCDAKDTFAVYRGLTELWNIVHDIESAAKDAPEENRARYVSELASIRKGLEHKTLNSPRDEVGQHFSASVLTRLEFCSDLFQKETEVDDVTLQSVKDEIAELTHVLVDANIPNSPLI